MFDVILEERISLFKNLNSKIIGNILNIKTVTLFTNAHYSWKLYENFCKYII